MNGELQSMIEIFIRIIFRGIRRQEEDLNLLPVFLQPGSYQLSMMHLQIIQNQEYLLGGRIDQPSQKLDQPLLVHRPLIDHISYAALLIDGGEHIDTLSFGFHWQYGRVPFGSKTSLYGLTVTDACLVSPIDDRLFFFCPFQNLWIFLLFPPLDTLRILFHGALRWTLAAHPPAFHVVGYTPVADWLPIPLLDVLSDALQCPQFPRYFKILRPLLFDDFL